MLSRHFFALLCVVWFSATAHPKTYAQVTTPDGTFQINGGTVVNNKGMLVLSIQKLKIKPVEIDALDATLAEKLSAANISRGVMVAWSPDEVEFKEALFLSPEPERTADGRAGLPFPFYLCLSPSAGAVWNGDVPLAVSKEGVWAISTIAPDFYIYRDHNPAGTVVARVQQFYCTTEKDKLVAASAIRFEQVSFANAVTFQVNGQSFTIRRTATAFFGKVAATTPSHDRITIEDSLAKSLQWYVEGKDSKQYLTEFRFAGGQCSAVYGNALTIPLSAAQSLRKDVGAADKDTEKHFNEAIKSAQPRKAEGHGSLPPLNSGRGMQQTPT